MASTRRARTTRGREQSLFLLKPAALAVAVALSLGGTAYAAQLPTGPHSMTGVSASGINTVGNTMTVKTHANQAIVNWQSFSIGSTSKVDIQQLGASSTILNRVTGVNGQVDPSSILGTLQSNGRVFLLNPAGIVFGANAQVDVAGLVASTLRLSDTDFLANRLRFTDGAGAGSVVNDARPTKDLPKAGIHAREGGEVYLVGKSVTNNGVITTPKGQVVLAAGNSVELVNPGTPNLRVEIIAPSNEARNLGDIVADAGRVGIYAGLISHSGTIRADRAVATDDGRVILKATKDIDLDAGSRISASGRNGASGGSVEIAAQPGTGEDRSVIYAHGDIRADGASGGTVTIKGDSIMTTGTVSADGERGGGSIAVWAGHRQLGTASSKLSARGRSGGGGEIDVRGNSGLYTSGLLDASGAFGGVVRLLGADVKLADATVDASGTYGGGSIRAGGGFQGGEGLPAARNTVIGSGTTLNADAVRQGTGGKVAVWADGTTTFEGVISARGGRRGGNGGTVEVSGKDALRFGGTVNLGAPRGKAGTLLLDPKNLIIIPATAAQLGIELVDPNPGDNNQFGANTTTLSNANIQVRDPSDDFGGTDAGAVYLFDRTTGALLGAVQGASANEQLGSSVSNFSFSGSNYLIRSTLADVGGNVDAGAAILVSGATGAELGRVSGNAADEKLGSLGFQFIGSNYLIRSPDAAGVGGVAKGGAAILVDHNTGTEIGRVSGNAADERLSNLGVSTFGPNYIIRSPDANGAGGVSRGGAVIMAGGTTGTELGRVSGVSTDERLGDLFPSFLGSGNYVIRSPNRTVAGKANAGAVVLASGANGSQLGQVEGNATDEFLGDLGVITGLGNSNYMIRSPNAANGGVLNTGAVIVASGATGAEVGRVSGTATDERLGNEFPDFLGNGHYVIRSPDANGLAGVSQGGAAILANGTSGVEIGRVSGATAGERLGSEFLDHLFNGNYVIRSVDAGSGAGAVILADQALGTELGRVSGTSTTENLGSLGIREICCSASSNYLIRSPNALNTVTMATNAGAVIMASGTSGAELGRVSGTSTNERLGNLDVVFLDNGNYVVRSPDRAVVGSPTFANAGAVVLADGTNGSQLGQIQGTATNERLGSLGITELNNSNYLIRSPDRTNLGGVTTAGAVMLASGTNGAVVGQVEGATVGERLGSQFPDFLSSGNYVIRSINATAGGNANAGAVILANAADGTEIGRISGNAANERLGSQGISEICCSFVSYIIRSPDANGTAGVSLGGAVILANSATGLERGRVSGVSASERLGSLSPTFISNDYVIRSPNRTVGGNANAGAVVLADGTTGNQLGQVEGNAANERMGDLGITTLGSGDYLIRSPDAANGPTLDAGAVVMASGASGNELGRTSGVSAGERLGALSPTFLSNDNYVIRSPNRTVGPNANAGAVVLADGTTGNQLGQVEGNAANELLGNLGVTQVNNSNYVIRSPDANGVAGVSLGGAVIMASGTTGAELGRVSGGSAGERLGNSLTFLSNDNYIVRSVLADVGGMVDAGAAILASGTTGAEIGRVSGSSANERLGQTISTGFGGNSNYLIRSTQADVGGLTDAGAAILASGTTGTEIGRVSGNAADEFLSLQAPQFVTGGNYIIRSPDANGAGGVTKGGAMILVNLATGTELDRLSGTGVDERLGSLGFSTLSDNRLLIRSPDAPGAGGVAKGGAVIMAKVDGATLDEIGRSQGGTANEHFGAFGTDFFATASGDYLVRSPNASFGQSANAGAVVLVSGTTGMEIGRLSGRSANEQLGNNVVFLSGDRRLVRSPLADENGLTDSGRLFVVGPGLFGSAEFATDQLFSSAPTGDATISATAIINTLASGATLKLQANNDITLMSGANIIVVGGVPGGGLQLQAGRSILLHANILTNQGLITLVANETGDGMVLANRDPGEGFILFSPGVSVGNGFSSLANNGATALKVVAGAVNPGLTSTGNTTFTPNGNRIQIDVERPKAAPDFGAQLLSSIDKLADINDVLDEAGAEDKKKAEDEKKKQQECSG